MIEFALEKCKIGCCRERVRNEEIERKYRLRCEKYIIAVEGMVILANVFQISKSESGILFALD